MKATRRAVEKFHHQESGAVLLLMLAVCLILMMLGWVVYDTGQAARENIKMQSAGDMAAVSQSAIKARSMNMLAYTNVAKRSIFAVHSTYLASFMAYIDWASIVKSIAHVASMVGGEMDAISGDLESMADKWINIWRTEARDDFIDFSGIDLLTALELTADHEDYRISLSDFPRPSVMELISTLISGDGVSGVVSLLADAFLDLSEGLSLVKFDSDGSMRRGSHRIGLDQWAGLSTKYYAQDLKALDNYQRYLVGITPWWGWMEHLIRGFRNGATASASYPNPPGMSTFGTGLLDDISSTIGRNSEDQGTTPGRDTLPVRPGDGPIFERSGVPQEQRETMSHEIREHVEGQVLGSVADLLESVTKDSSGGLNLSVDDKIFVVEHLANLAVTVFNSDFPDYQNDAGGLAGQAIAGLVRGGGLEALVAVRAHSRFIDDALEMSQLVFSKELGKYTVDPWVLLRFRHEGAWLDKTSNLVFIYGGRNELFELDRQKYEVIDKDYEVMDPTTGLSQGAFGFLGESIYRSPGMWALSRAEIYYAGAEDETPSMWNPVWSARLRPVLLPGELDQGGTPVDRAFRDVTTAFGMAGILNPEFSAQQALPDMVQLSRALSAMGPSTSDGVTK